MNALTIRGIDDQVLEQLKKQARSRQSSMNKFLVETLRKVSFPVEAGKVREWHDLDGFLGSWSAEESKVIMERARKCRKMDKELWK